MLRLNSNYHNLQSLSGQKVYPEKTPELSLFNTNNDDAQDQVVKKVNENKTLNRKDTQVYQTVLGCKSPLYTEINRKLLLFTSGIHQLSNGVKINATEQRLKGGGRLEVINLAFQIASSFIPDGNSVRISSIQTQIHGLRTNLESITELIITSLSNIIRHVELMAVRNALINVSDNLQHTKTLLKNFEQEFLETNEISGIHAKKLLENLGVSIKLCKFVRETL